MCPSPRFDSMKDWSSSRLTGPVTFDVLALTQERQTVSISQSRLGRITNDDSEPYHLQQSKLSSSG